MKPFHYETDSELMLDENMMPIVKQIAERMPGGFFIYRADEQGELIFANSAVIRIFGCDTQEEFAYMTDFSFRGMVHPDDLDRVEASIQEQIQNSRHDLDYVEYRIIQKNGEIRWIEDYGHFVHTEAYGDIFYVFIEDATERLKKQMFELEKVNEELLEANVRESRYKEAILHEAVAFFEVNLTKDEFISELIQVKKEEQEPLHEEDAVSFPTYSSFIASVENRVEAEDLESYRQFVDAKRLSVCCDNGELEQTYDCWISSRSGSRRIRFIFLLGRSEETGDTIALSVAKDITEQVEHQQLLQSALLQARTADIARNTFLSNMSHDIRTPLNAIIGYTELAKKHHAEVDKIDEYMDKIRISGEQLLEIVNESLEVTRIESGRVKLIERECCLEDLFAEIRKFIEPRIDAKAIQFIIDKEQVRHFTVIVDSMRLKEILQQLFDNAVKYTNPGGRICLTVTETATGLAGSANYQFIVEDNGNGISQEFMPDLFKPFKREKNTTQSKVHGTGLGLTVVKSLVDMMEGSIEVESRSGCGSKFIVNLLLKYKEGAVSHKPVTAVLPVDKNPSVDKRILLVEDNEINREIAEELLKGQGYLIETAGDGMEAVEKVKNSVPGYYALILMDIQMPFMDGYEAAQAIRGLQDSELANIPIIALSANAFTEDYERSLEAGMNAHFPKPIMIEELQELLESVLHSMR